MADWSAGEASPRAKKAMSTASIHIKPQNKGKFTAYANSKGQSVLQAATNVLNNKNATPTLKKRANFAKNAASWKKG